MNLKSYFARTGRVGSVDLVSRTPELASLCNKKISLFGLGCLGAPSALEFARAGIGELRILDFDHVDPGTICRWPIGLGATGLLKVDAIKGFIDCNYPYTQVVTFPHRLGSVRSENGDAPSDLDVLAKILDGTSLIYDAAAEVGIQHVLTDLAVQLEIPYVGVSGFPGGWGGHVFQIDSKKDSGCWMCYRLAINEEIIPLPPTPDDDKGTVQPVGCADPTFTGSGFDMLQIALSGVRMAVSALCEDQPDGYPATPWDVTVISFRNESGELIEPKFECFPIKKHPDCENCSSRTSSHRECGLNQTSSAI